MSQPASSAARRLRVVELGTSWGLGGTEQAIELRAALLERAWFDVLAVGLVGGPRFARLEARGVSSVELGGELGRLRSVLATFAPDVVHYTRFERSCAYSGAVQLACAEARVPVVMETNVFGRPAGWEQRRPPDITGHMSLASMLRSARLRGVSMQRLFDEGHRAVYLPVPTREGYGGLAEVSREHARAELGVEPGEVLACRVARPDLRKWSVRLELALPRLFAALPELRFALMSPPAEKRRMLERRFGRRVLCLDTRADFDGVARIYAAADLMLHSSGIGESFGLSLAEGMSWGLPVVVDSTPRMDNAQVEVVEHGATGFVVAASSGFVVAAERLVREPALRREMGVAARERARARFADRVVVAEWERLYAGCCAKAGLALPEELVERRLRTPSILDDECYRTFASDYDRRCKNVLGPNSDLSERALESLMRAGDTWRYARRLGPQAVWRVLRSRFRSGSLSRD